MQSYKDTLNLPRTFFPMKASLASREPERLGLWQKENVYAAVREKCGRAKERYLLHDGPPYANGPIHIGHALNKILKDIIVKYKTMAGYDALYVPGWDCHGLPIEHQCLKEMGKRKDEVERVAFRKQARKYAEKFIAIQREEFKRLGVFGEWEKPYRTMDFSYQAEIARSFLDLYAKGYIEQRRKPVPWCFECETALADAELEYEEKTSASVYVAFPVEETLKSVSDREWDAGDWMSFIFEKKLSFLVWTTTPWTLPANIGLAFHPQLRYVIAETDKGCFVFAESLKEKLAEKMGWNRCKIIKAFKSEKEFPFEKAHHPFLEKRESKCIFADYVSAEEGTGIVHIAPGHGEEDYQEGHLKNHLEVLSPVDEKGRFTKEFPPCEGMHVFKANEKIIDILKQKGALLHTEEVQHSYPHCWRCKKPIIFRATPQWFLKIDHQDDGVSLRQKMLHAIHNEIQFTPDWGRNRIGSMIEARPDWCLSRQRYWGVPIPLIRCRECGKVFASETKERIMELFREYGADVWFEKEAAQFSPRGENLACCAKPSLEKEEDIIDVWFDSGVSHQAVLKSSSSPATSPEIASGATRPRNDYGLRFPADLYLEGSDQHRGWFQSALTTAMALEGAPPFRGVLTHGFVVDGEGKKMSKSAGNVVAPQDVMREYGADILRLWVSSCDYQFDVRLSKEILDQMADAYRKIRNTFRYMLANLFDFSPAKDALPLASLHPLDRWAVGKAERLVRHVDAAYQAFRFHQIYRALHDFCTMDLSAYYFDILKDILYTEHRHSERRRSAQTALFHLLNRLVRLIAPVLCFTADEVWRSLPIDSPVKSVHAADFLVKDEAGEVDESLMKEWETLRALRDAVTPFLEQKRMERLIGSSLDAKVELRIPASPLSQVLERRSRELPRVLIVSQVEFCDRIAEGMQEIDFSSPFQTDSAKIGILVGRADGKKCVRCWNYSVQVGRHHEHPGLCEKCLEAIR